MYLSTGAFTQTAKLPWSMQVGSKNWISAYTPVIIFLIWISKSYNQSVLHLCTCIPTIPNPRPYTREAITIHHHPVPRPHPHHTHPRYYRQTIPQHRPFRLSIRRCSRGHPRCFPQCCPSRPRPCSRSGQSPLRYCRGSVRLRRPVVMNQYAPCISIVEGIG